MKNLPSICVLCEGGGRLRQTLKKWSLAISIVCVISSAEAQVIWKTYDPFPAGSPEGVLPSAADPAWTSAQGSTYFSLNSGNQTLQFDYPRNTTPINSYEIGSPGWSSQTASPTGNTVIFSLRALTLGTDATQTASLFLYDGARRYRLEFAPGKFGINQTGLGIEWYNLADSTSFNTYTVTFTPASQGINVYLNGATSPTATGIRSANDAVNNKIQFGVFTSGTTGGSLQLEYMTWTNDGMFTPIPEPSSALLLGVGALVFLAGRKRRRI